MAVLLIAALAGFFYLYATLSKRHSDIPLINPKQSFEFSNQRRLNDFRDNCRQLMALGKSKYPNNPFRMFCPEGEVIVWPIQSINELRSEPGLEFIGTSTDDSKSHIPGFQPFGVSQESSIVVNKYLNKVMGRLPARTRERYEFVLITMSAKLTQPISQETSLALAEILPDCPNWIEIAPAQYILPIIARVSSRVFLGEQMCRNREWIDASAGYATAAFSTQGELARWPIILRPFVHWFLPSCHEVRSKFSKAQHILEPFVQERKALKASASVAGKTLPAFEDAIEWFQDICGDNFDATVGQISLSMAAIHTTSDLLHQAMTQIAQHPELFEPLRKEVTEVFRTQGFNKTALRELFLMDSVLKESQRMKPILLSTMRRIAVKDIQLPSGFVLYKGEKVIVDSTNMWGSAYYENAERFDGYRFLNLRKDPEKANTAQLASASPDHMGFGYGLRSCPGRFFAANEAKIVLAYLLLRYEWKLAGGSKPKNLCVGYAIVGDPTMKFLIKRRPEELDLASLSD